MTDRGRNEPMNYSIYLDITYFARGTRVAGVTFNHFLPRISGCITEKCVQFAGSTRKISNTWIPW